MKTKIAAVLIVCCMIFAHLDVVKPDAGDCYDGCITACVQPNTRIMRRCELKCGIRCNAGSQTEYPFKLKS